jgi:glucose/arabinose dehydrogenase
MHRWTLPFTLCLLTATTDDAGAQGAAQPGDTVRASTVTGHLLQPRRLEFDSAFVREISVPAGFSVGLFATNVAGGARMMAVSPDGAVYVTLRDSGQVMLLRDRNGDGRAEERRVVVRDLPGVHGIHLHDGRMYLATVREIWVAGMQADGTVGMPRMIVDDLPDGGQHPNRTLAIGGDGMLYISIGSTCNSCSETNSEHAALLRMNADGSNRGVYAHGLRNLIGWDWHPETGELWGMDHGSDWRGDDVPPEELNRIGLGANYGWPYCYGERHVDPYTASAPAGTGRQQFCEGSAAPALTYTAHAAPIGMVFYDAAQFPAAYRGDAFVVFRGSWNRSPPSGYSVARVRFNAGGQPEAIEEFATGFLTADGRAFRARLADIVIASDGALLVSDDTNGAIYRFSHSAR